MTECEPDNCPGWTKTTTPYGTCCSFNYFPMAPLSASVLNQSGKFGALHIIFSGRNIADTGLMLIVAQSNAFITHYDNSLPIFPGFDNFFGIHSLKDTGTSQFQNLPLKYRQCMMPTDGDSNHIARSRCMLLCATEIIYKECACHPYFMPNFQEPSKSIRNCDVRDLLCFRDKPGILQHVHREIAMNFKIFHSFLSFLCG